MSATDILRNSLIVIGLAAASYGAIAVVLNQFHLLPGAPLSITYEVYPAIAGGALALIAYLSGLKDPEEPEEPQAAAQDIE